MLSGRCGAAGALIHLRIPEACSSALSTSISPVEVAWLPVSCCQVTVVGRKTVSSSASTAWREW